MTLRSDMLYQIEKAKGLARLGDIKRQLTPAPAQRERTPIGPDDIVDTFLDSPDRIKEE